MADYADRGDLARLGGAGRFGDLILVVAAQLPTVCANEGVAASSAPAASSMLSLVI
jgi:hypothetical protein